MGAMSADSVSKNQPPSALRRPSGAEEGEAAHSAMKPCGRRGGGSASPTNQEAQSLSNSCSGSEGKSTMAEKRRLPRRRAGAVAPTSGGSKRRKRSAGNRRAGAPPAAEPVPENPPPADPEETYAKFPIVGIGASAGGLEACSELLSVLPENAGMALVVVQHLAPKHHSILPDLLQASSHLPVVHASEGIEVA